MTTHKTATRFDKEYRFEADMLWGMYPWLDRAPLGRDEQGGWWRRHDEYGQR
jgi:predicted dithiol-disulfide oxidoreductase (DUF899 family)